MAWPPASSGTWAVRHEFTGAYPRPTNIQYVSDTLIYYGDQLGVATYNAVAGTSTIIGDDTDWSLGDVFGAKLAMFNNDLYILVTSFFDPDEKIKIFRYNGFAHNWTLVYLADDFNPHDGVTGPELFRTVSGLIVSSNEGIMFSSNPSLGGWSLITDQKGFADYTSTYIANDGNQSYALLTEFEDPDFSYGLYQFSEGAFVLIDSSPDVVEYVRTPNYHWGLTGNKWSSDGTTWNTPTPSSAAPYTLRNYTKTIGFSDGLNGLYFWDDVNNQWSATVDSLVIPLMLTPEAFVMSDGKPILGRYSGSTASFYERSVNFDTAFIPEEEETGKRLYIYKSEGADWVSKGIKTADD